MQKAQYIVLIVTVSLVVVASVAELKSPRGMPIEQPHDHRESPVQFFNTSMLKLAFPGITITPAGASPGISQDGA